MKVFTLLSLIVGLLLIGSGVSDDVTEKVSVEEGDSITLQTGVQKTQQDRIKWYFNDTRIAHIYGDLSDVCTDVQCKERFRDRLKLDHQTGSLTITNTRTEHAGVYKLQINSLIKSFIVTVTGSSGVQKDKVSVCVMEGDSVTLNTDNLIKTNQQDRFRWYFNDTRIAQIVGDDSQICTDVQCKERFRDRLKLDLQTGSLTITNINTTDTGEYKLQMITSSSRFSEKIFCVAIRGFPVAELEKIKSVKEGETVTLSTGEVKNPNDVMTWYFNDIVIAEITGDQSKICTDVQCNERFRDRLKLDHQTGSLNITNTRTEDSGLYELKITSTSISSSFSICRRRLGRSISISITSVKSFSVYVIDSGLSSGAVAGIVVGVLLVFAAAAAAVSAVIYYRHKNQREPGRHCRRLVS